MVEENAQASQRAPTETRPSTTVSDDSTSAWQLDLEKLHSLPSEQQELYLLSFSTDLLQRVDALENAAVTEQQSAIKKELLKIIELSSPAPTRIVRGLLGRVFATIYAKCNRRTLHETINDLTTIINAGKEKTTRARHAATYCLGAVFEGAGDSAISLAPLAATSLFKQIKLAAVDTGLRAATYRALGKIVKGIVSAIDEELGRTLWKQARSVFGGDKSYLVQVNAAWLLEQLVKHTTYFDNTSDFDKLHSTLVKTFDSPSSAVRNAASTCLAEMLIKSHDSTSNGEVVPRIKKPKKSKKSTLPEDTEDAIVRSASPVPEKPSMVVTHTIPDILRLLCIDYTKSATSNRMRASLIACLIKVLRAFGEDTLEQNYEAIARYLLFDLLGHGSLQFHRFRLLITRKFVALVLEQVIGPRLGESAQLTACRYLVNSVLKDYPQTVKERPIPPKDTLIGAVSALSSLMRRLDGAVFAIADLCRESLIQILQHPSFSVQIQTALALRTFALACPQQILATMTICLNSVQRELGQLTSSNRGSRRCVGFAYGLCAVLHASSQHPLYGSVDVYARVMSLATEQLKSSAGSDLHISACQVQLAWILIGGLMSLGPNFVKIHLSQLMLMWRNTLPKPPNRESIRQRNLLELSYLTHIRECALASIRAFLLYNQRLLTSDVSRRIGNMLEATVAFVQYLPDKQRSDEPSMRLSPAFELQDYKIMIDRRVLQCFSSLLALSPPNSVEGTTHSAVLTLAVSSFSAIDYDPPNALAASIASGSFESIWDVGDDYGFGVTGLVSPLHSRNPVTGALDKHWLEITGVEHDVEALVQSPICAVPENDPMCCYLPEGRDEYCSVDPAATEVVNSAIAAFALSLPLQMAKVQESVLEQISSALTSTALQKEPARRAAVTLNIALAIKTALETRNNAATRTLSELSRSEQAIQTLLQLLISSPDAIVRMMIGAAFGRLCSSAGSDFSTSQVTWLTETIVNNRDPNARAGCAVALAAIHSHLGSMAAGLHIKNIVGILMSLAADTHPTVHFWALDSLAVVADSAGLNFAAYVNGSVGMLSQLYVAESHNEETESLISSNILIDLPISAAIARSAVSLINVLGPSLQDMAKARDMIVTLVRLFSDETSTSAQLAGLRCQENLSLYVPNHFDLQPYVRALQADLEDEDINIREAALEGLHHLMRRDATLIIELARPGLEDRLWSILDDEPETAVIKNIFTNWLQHTGNSSPDEWVARCSAILTRTKSKLSQEAKSAPPKQSAAPEIQDEEVAGFAITPGASRGDDTLAATSTQELLRWQVRLFAMECLHTLIVMIEKDSVVRPDSPGLIALQQRISDVIRIAFSASTAGVAALRVIGLRIIEQILKLFGKIPDPDFSEAMLLEQYQAQISSALTPAFASDSSPALAAEAVNVCATFISTGIVTDIDRMGRILKLLVSALESFAQATEVASIGDLQALSSNAQVMVRMSVFAAWADLQVASTEQKYLVDVVKPHIAQLVPLWLNSLREYARLRFEPEISATASTPQSSTNLDVVYAALNRQALLQFYQNSWLSLVDAIASLIDDDSAVVFDALDAKQSNDELQTPNGTHVVDQRTGINYREEPVAFFFVLFGLAFEALAITRADDDITNQQRKIEILQALQKILRPSVSGNAAYQDSIFSELIDLMDRMVLTEKMSVQSIIVEIATSLCVTHPSAKHSITSPTNGDSLSEDIEQLFELTRIMVLVLAGIIPGLSDTPVSVRLQNSDEASTLVHTALQALVNVADVFPTIIRTDLRDAILHIFIVILGTGACQAVVVPQSLPMFRRLVASMAEQPLPHTERQLSNALARMLSILSIAQRRENEASLACEKNILLAGALMITASSSILAQDSAIIQRYISELTDCLHATMTMRIAVGCIRTLLMAGIASKQLLAVAFDFMDKDVDAEVADESKALMAQSLVMYLARAPTKQKPVLLALCMSSFLGRAEKDGSRIHGEMANRILDLSKIDNDTFRALVGHMEAGQKSLLQKVLATQAVQRSNDSQGAEREPTIALKLDFGG